MSTKIQNEGQLQITKRHLRSFKESWRQLITEPIPESVHPLVHQAQIDAIEYKIKDFEQEIDEYNRYQESLNKKTLLTIKPVQMLKLKPLAVPWRPSKDFDRITINEIGRINFWSSKIMNEFEFNGVEFFSFAMDTADEASNSSAVFLMPNYDPEQNSRINLNRTDKQQPYIIMKTPLDVYRIHYPATVDYSIIKYPIFEWSEEEQKEVLAYDIPVIKLDTSFRKANSIPLTRDEIVQHKGTLAASTEPPPPPPPPPESTKPNPPLPPPPPPPKRATAKTTGKGGPQKGKKRGTYKKRNS